MAARSASSRTLSPRSTSTALSICSCETTMARLVMRLDRRHARLVQRRRIAAGGSSQGTPDVEVDVVRDEPRGAVAEGGVDADGMSAAGGDAFLAVGIGIARFGIGMVEARRIQTIGGRAGLLGDVGLRRVRGELGLKMA